MVGRFFQNKKISSGLIEAFDKKGKSDIVFVISFSSFDYSYVCFKRDSFRKKKFYCDVDRFSAGLYRSRIFHETASSSRKRQIFSVISQT